jgi:hypothetical protein
MHTGGQPWVDLCACLCQSVEQRGKHAVSVELHTITFRGPIQDAGWPELLQSCIL